MSKTTQGKKIAGKARRRAKRKLPVHSEPEPTIAEAAAEAVDPVDESQDPSANGEPLTDGPSTSE